MRTTKSCLTCGKAFWSKDLHRAKYCSRPCIQPATSRERVTQAKVSSNPLVFADQLVACRGVGFDFYPEDGERAQEAAVRLRPLAWSYCRRCPVRAACEAEGAQGEQGLWGGVLYWPGRRTPVDLLAPVLAGVS